MFLCSDTAGVPILRIIAIRPNSQLHLFIKNITKVVLRVAGPANLEKSKGEKL